MTTLTERPRTVFTPPPGAFAPVPAEERGVARDAVRMLVAHGDRDGARDGVVHARFRDLPDHLRPGDVVVVNDSATEPGEWDAVHHRADGGSAPVVVHAAGRLDRRTRVVEVRTAPDAARAVLDAAPGDVLRAGSGAGEVAVRLLVGYPHAGSSPTGTGDRLWRAEVVGDLDAHLARHGRPIAYGYLARRLPLSAYQTVFATRPGSAEMPSAARPFTEALVTRLVSRGVAVVPVTLHTGVSSQEAGEGPQPEWFAVPEPTARLVTAVRAGGGRVVAVGTTATRALESAVGDDGRLVAASGWTERVVTPARPPRVVDGLVTGWHDPGASHLLLVEAVAGPEVAQRAYDAASAGGYLWHEFGDTALLLP